VCAAARDAAIVRAVDPIATVAIDTTLRRGIGHERVDPSIESEGVDARIKRGPLL
jgi:hypothetical protein